MEQPLAGRFHAGDSLQRRVTFLLNSFHRQPVLDAALQTFLLNLLEFLPARFASVWLFNGLDDTLVLRDIAPLRLDDCDVSLQSLPRRVLHISECLSGETVRTRHYQVFKQTLGIPLNANAAFQRKHALSTLISFPIFGIDDRVSGVINAYTSLDANVDSDDIEVAACAVRALAETLELAHLTRERNVERQLSAFSAQLVAGEVDARTAWDGLAQQIAYALEGEACSIFMKKSSESLQLIGTTGMIGDPPYDTVVYLSGQGLTGRCFQSNRPIIYYREHSTELTAVHKSIHRERLTSSTQSESIVLVPIRNSDGAAIGVIRCNNKRFTRDKTVGRFTTEDMNLLEGISSFIADTEVKEAWIRRREKDREATITYIQHELIAPLQHVLSHVESLTSLATFEKAGDAAMLALGRSRLDMIADTVKKTAFMIRVVIEHDKGRLDHVEEVALVEAAVEVTTWLRDEARRHSVRTSVAADSKITVVGDPFQLMRLLFNLLRNAITYYDEIETERRAVLRLTSIDNTVVIECEDNGMGVSLDEVEALFGKRVRGDRAAKRRPEGLGIGLAACRAITRAHGGTIQVANIAKPTLFRVTLPRVCSQESNG
jgi:signal transduction histidine kinase